MGRPSSTIEVPNERRRFDHRRTTPDSDHSDGYRRSRRRRSPSYDSYDRNRDRRRDRRRSTSPERRSPRPTAYNDGLPNGDVLPKKFGRRSGGSYLDRDRRPDSDSDEELKGLSFEEYRRLKRQKMRKSLKHCIWNVTPSPPRRENEQESEEERAEEITVKFGVEKGDSSDKEVKPSEKSKSEPKSEKFSESEAESDDSRSRKKRRRVSGLKRRRRSNSDSESEENESDSEDSESESDDSISRRKRKRSSKSKHRRRRESNNDSESEGSDAEEEERKSRRGKRKSGKTRGNRKKRRYSDSDESEESESHDSASDSDDSGRRKRKHSSRSKRSRRERRKRRSRKSESEKEVSESEEEKGFGDAKNKAVVEEVMKTEVDPEALKLKELFESQKKPALDNEPAVGPMPLPRAEGHISYGGALRPGEGDAIAQYVQQGKRIPRRGEVGLSAEEIQKFETLGYVMSGSRHQRMNAIRIRKENQVYSAEDKRALAMFNYEEKAKREHKVMADLQRLVQRHIGQDVGPTHDPFAAKTSDGADA
ncbi:hypothetical protein HN51_060057 [Arachis hypogaea]|uniref:uncharacterized protein n=1 Tax=Arachis hypogaea TaxID=3818 RepID=UPI000DEDD60C|nr:NF-kappa-B-activating protein [Arachis hypogaea]XP_025680542.1 NF-kappa-B-activating protein [Arachis hypogaea]XP_025680544.1 NF-kappa-B-activating protein [Arachis hypogaea]QHN83618.1 uncharacterized protein DS421_20g706300 [Arachis hypogaea]QHN83619.1 uncharacterized protein DS421_20g706300 [Arachis hypogaea]QHN83620.1 uncharacterized protein DS421_20g706300 [Arachis hypogaea]QHN83621.1 uncharacterized protein DS421_20g706300 [Arachis hypogaea]